MKVKELIAELQKITDQNMTVITDDSFDITAVDQDDACLYDRGSGDVVVLQCGED